MIFWLNVLIGIGCVILGQRMRVHAAADKTAWAYVTGMLHRVNLFTPMTVTWQRPDGTSVAATVDHRDTENLPNGPVGMWVHPSDPTRFRLDTPSRNALPRNIVLLGFGLTVLGTAAGIYNGLP